MEQELVGKLKARVSALKHRHPARSLKVIAVAGAAGKTTTALLLTELLREAGRSVLVLTDRGSYLNGQKLDLSYDATPDDTQRSLNLARQKDVDIVVMELTEALVANHVLSTIPIEMSVVTGASSLADALLNQPVNYTVVPSGLDLGGLSVAPHQAISYGDDVTAEAQVVKVKLRRRGTEVDLVVDHQTIVQLATYLIGKANVYNLAAAVSAAYVLAIDVASLPEGVARLEGVVGNYEYLESSRPYDIVVDGAAEDVSLELVLSSAAELKRRRLLVAMDTTVKPDDRLKLKKYCDRLVMVGLDEQAPGIDQAETLEAAVELVTRGAKKDDLVLLVGREFAARETDNTTKAQRLLEHKGE